MLRFKHQVLRALCCGSFLASSPASAETSRATQQLLRSALQFTAGSDGRERTALVQVASDYCAEVSKIYPRNSPAEEEWLRSESNGGENRVVRVLQSAELGRRFAANFTTQCKAYASAYSATVQRRTALIGLAYTFTQFERDASLYAHKNAVDGERYGFGFLSGVTEALLLAALTTR